MTGYSIVNFSDVLKLRNEAKLEDDVKKAEKVIESINDSISAFSCPLNHDVESFLKDKALTFAQQSIAATYLIFTSYKGDIVLIAYFTLANKYLFVPKKALGSNEFKRKLAKFGEYNDDTKGYQLSIPLIAQLGKNFSNGYNELISGDELLKIACDKVEQIQIMISGKFTYVECEDNEYLIDFYKSNGFRRIKNRELAKVEKTEDDPDYLVQLIKYLKRK